MIFHGGVHILCNIIIYGKREAQAVALDTLFLLACERERIEEEFKTLMEGKVLLKNTPLNFFLKKLEEVKNGKQIIRQLIQPSQPYVIKRLARKLCRFLPNAGKRENKIE